MLAIFEVFSDDTVRARVFADWVRLDLTYSGGRCAVSEMVEVLPEGGEGGHWRLERRVYRDVEVPWYLCHAVIEPAVYPGKCKGGVVHWREVGGRLEAYAEVRSFDSHGALCPLPFYYVLQSLFALSTYLRDGTTVVNIKWGGIERVDAREWEEWYRDPTVVDLASWLRREIAYFRRDFLTTPPEPGVGVALWAMYDHNAWVDLSHDMMLMNLQMWDGRCGVGEYSMMLVERRGGEYVLSGRGGFGPNAPDLPRHLCDALMDRLFSLRDAWRGVSESTISVGEVEGPGLEARIDLIDFAARGDMELLRPLYAIYLTAAGLPVRSIDGEDVDSWASRHPPRDWHRAILEEIERRFGRGERRRGESMK